MRSALCLFLAALLLHASNACGLSTEEILPLVTQQNITAIRSLGQESLDPLVSLYKSGDVSQRTKVAAILYGLGWKSKAAKDALMEDLHTKHEALRLQVQWALGRVSNDDDVVASLLANMKNDPNPLFRDKAACALADDQIHLTDMQKVKLYEGVIQSLADEKEDVRRIANQVLQIQTGQNKGFRFNASLAERQSAIEAWKQWLHEYRKAVDGE